MPPQCATGQLLQYDGGWLCASPTQPMGAADAGKYCHADAEGASVACDVAPAALPTPPSCMPPGGARLEYTEASGWACACAPGYYGLSCTLGSGSGSGGSPCTPPPCDAPGGAGTYTLSGGIFTCVCAAGYAGSPCALPMPPPAPPTPASPSLVCGPGNDVNVCFALGDFYTATNGAGWISNSGWASAAAGVATDYCSFYGVTCDGGVIVDVELYGNQLNGTISASLGSLTGLTQLLLMQNQLSGTIPATLSSLTSLRLLALHINELSGVIPTSLGSMTGLTQLCVRSFA